MGSSRAQERDPRATGDQARRVRREEEDQVEVREEMQEKEVGKEEVHIPP